MDIDEKYYRDLVRTYLNENPIPQQETPKKPSLLDKIFSKTIKLEVPAVIFGLYFLCVSVFPLGVTSVRKAELSEGKKEGIELMKTIYNTQGGNEALRYTSYNK
jgi:hypothetical protein